MFEAVILAGGFGTRMQGVLKDRPKALALINGRPFLEYLLNYLKSHDVGRVVLSVGFRSGLIIDYFGSEHNGIEIAYAIENKPLGTGGGLRMAIEQCKRENVLALNGDTLFLIDLKNFAERHAENNSKVSIALRRVPDVSRFGSVKVDENNIVTAFGEKIPEKVPGLINGGVYLLNRAFFMQQTPAGAFSVEKDFFERLYPEINISGFDYDDYFIDIGIAEDFIRAQNEFKKLTN